MESPCAKLCPTEIIDNRSKQHIGVGLCSGRICSKKWLRRRFGGGRRPDWAGGDTHHTPRLCQTPYGRLATGDRVPAQVIMPKLEALVVDVIPKPEVLVVAFEFCYW